MSIYPTPKTLRVSAFGAVAAVALVAGCGVGGDTEPTAQNRVFPATEADPTTEYAPLTTGYAAPTTEYAAPTLSDDQNDQIYLAVLSERGITRLQGTSVSLIAFGETVVCGALEEEVHPTPAFAAGLALGAVEYFDSYDDAAYAIGAAIATYCPRFEYVFDE
ncbi:DUF732 domain-containing protein [Nocardia caishijiensis]|uniref:Uncharacterized protein DUF732 n=1 Tax=Nocardia caishijiensis TaxID=184756 RepID=A0ABQ6YJF8_9NOCA|nr:DUF732 domain-containing protein [Nocardia caishijiensis]KAF0845923.1 uncharacterized protein DUF732 [Nocardia caishijiensis]